MHNRGLFAVSVITSTFMRMVETEARFFGIPLMPIVETPHHPGAVTHDEARIDAEAITPTLVAFMNGQLEARL
jgi:hypothetical protein